MTYRRVARPDELARLFEADRETHVYGLADLEEPFWSASAWFTSGEAVVGRVSTGGSWVTGYAMTREHRLETLDLLARIEKRLPAGTLVTGPLGLHEHLSRIRRSRDLGVHWRMILRDLDDGGALGEADDLGPEDVDDLLALHETAPGESFFLPSMLSQGVFVGIRRDSRLVASAGTHVASDAHGVAAIGAVITHPSYRGFGLGKTVVASLCRRLVSRYRTVGLNVSDRNLAAIQLYDQLGFEKAFEYEEIELL